MFGVGENLGKLRAKRGIIGPNKDIWNGWTQRLIESINGAGRFDVRMNGLTVTLSFKGVRDITERLPILERDYPDVDVKYWSRWSGINCEINIVRVAMLDGVESESAGVLVLTSTDHVGGADPAHEWRMPHMLMSLHDVDGSVTATGVQCRASQRWDSRTTRALG